MRKLVIAAALLAASAVCSANTGVAFVHGTGRQTNATADYWKPAFVEIEDALVPSFIIEEHEDGRFTVFVPSVPTPFAGAVYVLGRERVHPLDIPFTTALKPISRWGAGCKDLIVAMKGVSTTAGGR